MEVNQVRVGAIHDTAGNIRSLLAWPAGDLRVSTKLEPWEYIHEVEVPDLALDVDDTKIHARLNEITKNFRVEVHTEVSDVPTEMGDMPKGRLVRKSSTQAY